MTTHQLRPYHLTRTPFVQSSYRARCSCGWSGAVRSNLDASAEDFQVHRDDIDEANVLAVDYLERAAARAVNSLRAERDAQPFGSRITSGTAPEPFDGLDVVA